MKSSCGNHHRPAGISNIASILVTAAGLIGRPSGKRHIPTYHPETEVTRSMSKLPRHTAIASCQPKQSTKMSMLFPRQIRHPPRRRQLRSHHRQLRLTLQWPRQRTATLFISPTIPPPVRSSKMPWLYIAVGFGVVALAYLVYPRSKLKAAMAARPTFYPHSDWDAPQRPPENVAINYGVYFHSNVSAGQDSLATDGANPILRKKKQ